MAIGPVLKEARLKKQLTASQVAEITRMKVQIVDDLEHDDFHRVAATIYGKGFIKLFAECVGIDPKPLIDDYMCSLQSGTPPGPPLDLAAAPPVEAAADPETPAPVPEPDAPLDDLFAFANSKRHRIHSGVSSPVGDPRTRAAHASPAHSDQRPRHHSPGPRLAWLRTVTAVIRGKCRTPAETAQRWLAGLKWNDRFIRILGISLAVIVALLVLIMLIRQISTRFGPRIVEDHELIFFIPPPEPYLD